MTNFSRVLLNPDRKHLTYEPPVILFLYEKAQLKKTFLLRKVNF